MRLTLSADHDEGYLRDWPVCGELVVDFVNFLEAGLIFQTENQDDSIHPTGKLGRREEERSCHDARGAGGRRGLTDIIRSSNWPELLGVLSPLWLSAGDSVRQAERPWNTGALQIHNRYYKPFPPADKCIPACTRRFRAKGKDTNPQYSPPASNFLLNGGVPEPIFRCTDLPEHPEWKDIRRKENMIKPHTCSV